MAENCDTNAECMNILGNFLCVCLSGFDGDGETCTGKLHVVINKLLYYNVIF